MTALGNAAHDCNRHGQRQRRQHQHAVNNAIAKIGATLSQLGSATIQLQGLEDYTTQLSDSVTTGLGAMVDANLSAESAQLSSLQTKQSLAIQSLTLANQGPSSLLQLFR